MEKKKKKTWTEPKLTALVRRKPEEDILVACKTNDQAGPAGPGDKCVGTASECAMDVVT